MANYFMETGGVWLPLAALAPDYNGPVIYTDETQTIQWFDKTGQSRGAVDHKEHEKSEAGDFVFEHGKPRLKARKVTPAYWAPARVVD